MQRKRLPRLRSVLGLVGACALAGVSHAQTIARVSPEVVSPGYLVSVQGADLDGTTELRFTGFVGGFTGTLTVAAPVISASATEVTALVPSISGWIPPWFQQGGSPFGTVVAAEALDSATSDPFPIYLLEGTGGLLANVGLGSTQLTGERPVISFDPGTPSPGGVATEPWKSVGSGAPAPGNASFVMELENATPGVTPFLFVGLPGPGFPVGDGIFAVDPAAILGVFVGSRTTASGNASVALPIPPSAEGIGPIVAQWVHFEGFAGLPKVSSALRINYL